jgi:integrase
MSTVQPIRNRDQINLMKKILKGESSRNHLLFTFGINVGLRISDILKFTIDDIVTNKGKVKDFVEIYEQKTKKHKRFVFSDVVKKAIKSYLDSLDQYKINDYLFKSREGKNKPLSRFMAYRILDNAAQEAGIDDSIGTHTMRKTFGYWAYKRGTDISLLQDIFNHSTPQVTLRYIGITQDQKDQVYITSDL